MTAPVAGASSEGIAPSSNDSVTTAAVTTNVSGSTFIAAITWDRPTPSVANFESIVDSKGNTYTTIGTQASYGPTSDPQARIFICENGVGGSGHTVTVTLTDPPNDMSLTLFFLEVIGGFLDQEGVATYTTQVGPYDSTTETTLFKDELLVSVVFQGAGANTTVTENTGFTVVQTVTDGATPRFVGGIGWKLAPTIGPYNSEWDVPPEDGGACVYLLTLRGIIPPPEGKEKPTLYLVDQSGGEGLFPDVRIEAWF